MNKKRYYPWVIMASCCVFLGLVMGVGTNCNGIFMNPVADSLGVGQGQVSTYVTVMGIASALAAPLVGNAINRIDIRRLLTISSLMTGAAFFALSRVNSLFAYCAVGAFVGVGVACGSFLPITVILNNWFVKHIGLVTGITLSSSSIVGIVMNPILSGVIQRYGWRAAYGLMGFMILCTLPVIWLFIRMYPDQKGSVAWGAGEAAEAATEGGESGDINSVSRVLRSKRFVTLVLFAVITSFFINHMSHMPSIAAASGLGAGIGAAMVSFAMAGEFTGKLAIGWLSDRVGILKAVYIVGALGMAGVVGMMFLAPEQHLLPLICAYAYGPMTAVGSVGYTLIVKDTVGAGLYPQCYPYINIASTVSFSIGFPVIGFIYDITGSYNMSFISTLIGLSISMVLLKMAIKKD